MPKVTTHTLSKLRAVEYGHGAYGVVFPTQGRTGAICKITSDPSEAHFIAAYHKLPRKPEGIVKYGPIFQLQAIREGRPVYILWREEAFDVGKVFVQGDEDAAQIMNEIFDATIPTCKIACSANTPANELSMIRDSAKSLSGHTGYEGGDAPSWISKVASKIALPTTKAGRGLATAAVLAKQLARIPKFRSIGQTMSYLIDHGILVTDVHDGNFGYVKRGGRRRRLAVITDPGNVAFVTTKYDRAVPKILRSTGYCDY